MNDIAHQILASTLEAPGALPLTRERVIAIAERVSGGRDATVHIHLEDDPVFHDGEYISLAKVVLSKSCDESWHLQYVSHPGRCDGLTAQIEVIDADIESHFTAFKQYWTDRPISPCCTAVLEAEGLGPYALLDLHVFPGCSAVPTQAHVDLLNRLESAYCEAQISKPHGPLSAPPFSPGNADDQNQSLPARIQTP